MLPKYVALKGNQYWYQRAWPSSIRGLMPTAKFRLSIGADRNASDNEIARAALVAEKAYKLECDRVDNSSTVAVEDAVLDKLADRALKDLGKSPGALSLKKLKTTKRKSGKIKAQDVISVSFKDGKEVPADKDRLQALLDRGVNYDERTGEVSVGELSKLTPEQALEVGQKIAIATLLHRLPGKDALDKQVKERVKERLKQRRATGPKRISQVWPIYNEVCGIVEDMDDPSYRKRERNWNHNLAVIGDHPLASHVDRDINEGLRESAQRDLERGVKPQSIKRNQTETIGALRFASREYNLGWQINPPTLPRARAKVNQAEQRKVASRPEQIALATSCVNKPDAKNAAILCMLHGMILTEVGNVRSVHGLEQKNPYVIIESGKTVHRRRLVPISFGADVVREFILQAAEWVTQSKDNGSATINKRIRTLLGDDTELTSYGLRHAARNCWVASSGASDALMYAALGWSGSGNKMNASIGYGSEGIEDSEMVATLSAASEKAYRHIIDALPGGSA